MKYWIFLVIAVIAEVIGTSALKQSDGFSKLLPSIIVIFGFGIAFYFLSLTLRVIPVGIVYAVWSGLGIVFISLVGWFVFKEKLDIPAFIGIALILTGIVVMNLFSKTNIH